MCDGMKIIKIDNDALLSQDRKCTYNLSIFRGAQAKNNVILVFSEELGQRTNNYAKLSAMYNGLIIYYQMGISKITIEIDSLLFSLWSQGSQPPWELWELWKKKNQLICLS